jgi:tRNA G18 (ribose-2'-O)-methylase SpoU
MLSPSSSSWVYPFLMGSATSLSALWIAQNWDRVIIAFQPTFKSTTAISTVQSYLQKSPIPPSNEQQQQQQQSQILDAPDLDQRMLRKCEAVLQWRTSRLVLVIERCTNDHNYSAILRTAEALGIQTVFMIDPPPLQLPVDWNDDEENNTIDKNGTNSTPSQQQSRQQQISRSAQESEQRRLHHLFAQNATEWLNVHDFETSEACVSELRRRGYQLWVTDLSQEAQALPLTNLTTGKTSTIPEKVALVMGTEAVGASQYILEQSDQRVYLPLRGFADSLNLSVATALILHHMFCLDPSLIGAMEEDERAALRKTWYIKLVQQRLLSTSQKKARTRLTGHIKTCQRILERTQRDPNYKLQPSEQKKLDHRTQFQNELDEIDAILEPSKVEAAIQEWLDHPPRPLTDLRRTDTHRVCFVGKNTKKIHKDHWKDMVATSNLSSMRGVTATPFREKVNNCSPFQQQDFCNTKGVE